MATSRDIRAGGAFVEIYADRNPLKKGLDASWNDIKKFSARANREIGQKLTNAFKVAAAGAVGLGAGIAVMAKSAINDLDQLNKTAKAFGLSAEAASGVFGVMRMSGATNIRENIESLVTLSDRVQQAFHEGDGQGAKLFEGLSVSAKQMINLDPAEQFFRLHEAIMKLENPVERVNKLMLAFGEDGGKTLIGSLSMSTKELRQQAAGLRVTQEELDKASRAQAAMNRLAVEWNKIVSDIAVTMAPAFESVSIAIREMLAQSNKVDDAFRAVSLSIEIIWQQMLERMDGRFEKFVTGLLGKFKPVNRTEFFDVEHEFLANQLVKAAHDVQASARNKVKRDSRSHWGKKPVGAEIDRKEAEEIVNFTLGGVFDAFGLPGMNELGPLNGPPVPQHIKDALADVAMGKMTPDQFDLHVAGQYMLDNTNRQSGLADLIKQRDELIEKILKADQEEIHRAVEAGRPEIIRPDAVEALKPKEEEKEAEEFRAISQYNDAIYSGTREAAEAIAKAMLPASDQLQKKQLAHLAGIDKGVAKLVKKDDVVLGVA